MLDAYKDWLESELKLLGNASHHAYSFGQANMAKRALEELDRQLGGKVVLVMSPQEADTALAALAAAGDSETVRGLAERLRTAREAR